MGKTIPLIWIAFLACTGSGVGIADRAQFEHAVQSRVGVWARAINNGSLDTLEDLYWHSRDLLVVWPDGDRTVGWPQASAKWKNWAAGPTALNYVAENPSVDILDQHVALATFGTTVMRRASGHATANAGRTIQVWVRDEKRIWKIRAEETAPIP